MRTYEFHLNGKDYSVTVKDLSNDHAMVEVNGEAYSIDIKNSSSPSVTPAVSAPKKASTTPRPSAPASAPPPSAPPPPAGEGNALAAPIPGSILDIYVKVGDEVKSGQPLVKMEAMKMENEVRATQDGKVQSISVSKGESVSQGQALLIVG